MSMKKAEAEFFESLRRARRNGNESRPELVPGNIWVGKRCYHTAWCGAINGNWLNGYVIRQAPLKSAQGRKCRLCAELEPRAEHPRSLHERVVVLEEQVAYLLERLD